MVDPSPIDQGIKLLREAAELLCSAASGNNRPATTTSTFNANRAERITSNLQSCFPFSWIIQVTKYKDDKWFLTPFYILNLTGKH